MSLPQYRLHDEENDIESINDFDQPLLSKKAQDDSSPPTYPPRLGGSSAIPGSSTTYHFVPRWPIKGNPESVLGVAGDKDYTIRMVQNAFPTLATYPAHKIEFLAPATPETKVTEKGCWNRILDEAWDSFGSSPPTRLLVQVAETTAEQEKREARERRQTIFVFSCAFSPFILLLVAFAVLGSMGYLDS